MVHKIERKTLLRAGQAAETVAAEKAHRGAAEQGSRGAGESQNSKHTFRFTKKNAAESSTSMA